jgi:signal transduction histidine kinase/DNA-binding response OmpR family regulator
LHPRAHLSAEFPTTDITLVLTFVIELLFVAVFARALLEYVRRRDPLTGDVVLVFSAMASLFVIQVGRTVATADPRFNLLPGIVSQVASFAAVVLLLLQPIFTLKLIGRLRPVPRWQYVWPIAAYVVATPLALAGSAAPAPARTVATIVLLIAFFATEAIAGGYLLREAVDHAGAARYRLITAATATILFGGALLAAGAGMAGDQAAAVGTGVARVLALLAGGGYVIAFMPPRWLRRIWQAGAGYRFTEQLLVTPPDEGPAELWSRFLRTAKASSGSDAVVVLVSREGSGVELHASGIEKPSVEPTEADFARVISSPDPGVQHPLAAADPAVQAIAAGTAARFVSIVPLMLRGGGSACALLLANWRTLFTADDSELMAATAAQTAMIAERQALLADQLSLSQQLARTVSALESASRAKSDFLASMSHELRTPLNAIIGFSELMRAEPADGRTLSVPSEWVAHISNSGQHLLGLINDVLDITKVEAGRLDLQLESIDISQAIAETVGGLRPLAERKNIAIEADVERRTIEVDRGRLRQILYNLLSNAIKFTPNDGRITMGVAFDGGYARVSVADTGIGIAPEDQPHVFEEFRQVGNAAAREEGTGLGLALTRRLVEAHGGSIELESEPGRGTTFTVSLPESSPIGEIAEARLERALGSVAVPGRRMGVEGSAPTDEDGDGRVQPQVLIIEDEPSAVRLLRTYVESINLGVVVANDGESGIAAARSRLPDAIILDVLLPGVDGWEVLRELKSDRLTRDIPVIIVTIVDERDVGLALGAVDYFVKPVDRTALIERLSRYTFTAKVRQREVRILAVDDDPSAVAMVEAALAPEGFTVVPAYDGRQALDLANEQPPDLVICDLLMPDLDGFGVVSALKSEPRTREVPILVLTAHELTADEKARLNGKILGVVDKGEVAALGLRDWLRRAASLAPGLVERAAGPLTEPLP